LKKDIHKTQRFLEHHKEKKYALAFAMGTKYPKLQETPQYIKMEQNYQVSLENAQKFILLNLQHKAKKQIQKYLTVISKRQELELITSQHEILRKFLLSYESNDFKQCYELMDKHKKLKLVKIAKLLEQHWSRLILKCEQYAINGDIFSIRKDFGTLLLTSTRLDIIDLLIRKTFLQKIKKLIQNKEKNSSEMIIYSYIDIFTQDEKITKLMNIFQKNFNVSLAISHKIKKDEKYPWLNSEITKNLNS
jgi:hypothetical protein